MGSASYNGMAGYLALLTGFSYKGPSTASSLGGGTGANFTRKGTYFGWALNSSQVANWYLSNMPGNGLLAANPPLQMLIPLRWGLRRAELLVTGPLGS